MRMNPINFPYVIFNIYERIRTLKGGETNS
nr:MAG TPA: hypothetical protein [Caudoviricetes sp.]